MTQIILKEIAKIVIAIVKSYCRILVLTVIVTVLRGYLVVTKALLMVNDQWPVVILSTDYKTHLK